MPDGEGDTGTHAGYLPPEPGGPEPDLGSREQPPGESSSARHGGFAPPAEHREAGPPQPTHPPIQQQLGWSSPAPADRSPPEDSTHVTGTTAPDNGSAVAGLTLSIASGALLLLSLSTSTIISVVCAALGIHYSRKGRARVDRGETTKHRDVAQAGFITGIVTLSLSILATLLWVLFAVVYATDEGFRQDLKDELDDGGGSSPRGFESTLILGSAAVRLLSSLLR